MKFRKTRPKVRGEMSPTRSVPSDCSPPHPAPWLRPVAALAMAMALLYPNASPAQDETSEEVEKGAEKPQLERYCVLPESYEMRPEVFVLVPGARRVGFSLYRETPVGLEPYKRSELRRSQLSWVECYLQGQRAATRFLKTLEPEYHRDERKIIEYAHFRSENPNTAAAAER